MVLKHLITAREAATLAGKSKSTIHRHATAGKLRIAEQVTREKYALLLFDPADVRETYGLTE